MSSMTFQHADVTSHMMQCVATTHVYTHYDFLKIETCRVCIRSN